MLNVGQSIRAFRPSRVIDPVDYIDDDAQSVKEANLKTYAERAEAGLPIFESLAAIQSLGQGAAG